MKRLFLSLSVAALLGAAVPAAFAQETDDFDKELQAFQKKAGAAQNAAPQASAEETPAEEAPAPATVAAEEPAPEAPSPDALESANPLGPAANLPVKPMPGTANALGMSPPAPLTPEEEEAELMLQKKKLQEKTFNSAIEELMPMTSEEIRRLLDIFKESRQASETPIKEPVPRVQVETVSLDPNQPPPVIRTSPGRVSTLIILDSTGAPWPIQDVSWAGKFEVTPPEEGGHVIRITPQTAHTMGNISIRLVDLITPVTFTLQTGLDEVVYRFDARIPKMGPLAKAPLIENGGLKSVVGGDENLVQILDGTPPGGAEKLKVSGTDGRTNVWRLSDRIYLRTPLTLLSPAWSSSVASADGMNVYVLNNAPVILLSDGGRVVRASIAAGEGAP
jgi:intracellular multiplication protein IcmK